MQSVRLKVETLFCSFEEQSESTGNIIYEFSLRFEKCKVSTECATASVRFSVAILAGPTVTFQEIAKGDTKSQHPSPVSELYYKFHSCCPSTLNRNSSSQDSKPAPSTTVVASHVWPLSPRNMVSPARDVLYV